MHILPTKIGGILQQCLLCFVPRKLLRKAEIYEVKINLIKKKIKCQRRACIGSVQLQHDSGVCLVGTCITTSHSHIWDVIHVYLL